MASQLRAGSQSQTNGAFGGFSSQSQSQYVVTPTPAVPSQPPYRIISSPSPLLPGAEDLGASFSSSEGEDKGSLWSQSSALNTTQEETESSQREDRLAKVT